MPRPRTESESDGETDSRTPDPSPNDEETMLWEPAVQRTSSVFRRMMRVSDTRHESATNTIRRYDESIATI
ncbi:GH19588 [Drosophila grimshawi]|uniref:GH19588 n=1 Tax=Drosophila grimshawi TaxID=7222 RepID=B4JHS7_DROGR|nr:GH19588 [Drosophila grimshawi]